MGLQTAFRVYPCTNSGTTWDRNQHEFAVYTINLPERYNPLQIQQLYRERDDTENAFEGLKNQQGFNGFCAQSHTTTVTEVPAGRILPLLVLRALGGAGARPFADSSPIFLQPSAVFFRFGHGLYGPFCAQFLVRPKMQAVADAKFTAKLHDGL